MPARVLVVFGTRPEAIKMAPVIERLRAHPRLEPIVAVTGQHREMLDQVLDLFSIEPDFDLGIMRPGQTLTDITTRTLSGLAPVIETTRPDAMLVQGDTTTCMAGALAAFHANVPVGHVEAGLRTADPLLPFPEEMNRRLTTRLARWHFAPTESTALNLRAEGVPSRHITVTGNTVVDALLHVMTLPHSFPPGHVGDALASGRRVVLVTAHRRENWGAAMESIFRAVDRLADRFKDVHVLVAAHLNPLVRDTARRLLDGRERITLLGPMEYLPFIKLMDASTLVLSDSGGVQEEAPTLGCPVLVLRDVTERPEAMECGVELVGTDEERILERASVLLSLPSPRGTGARVNPFGDGHAALRICDVLDGDLDASMPRRSWIPGVVAGSSPARLESGRAPGIE